MNCLIEKDSSGDNCSNCLQPFIRCFLNFDILPLVEFSPSASISQDEVLSSLCKYPAIGETSSNDLFNEAIGKSLNENEAGTYKPVEVDKMTLESIKRDDVYMIEKSSRYFKNVIPEIGIAVCQNCHSFFHEEDYEYMCLQEGACPVCETKTSSNVSKNMYTLSQQ